MFDILPGLLGGVDWEAITAVFTAAHALALAIVNLTPTPKDNEMVAKWYRAVEILAGIIIPRVKH